MNNNNILYFGGFFLPNKNAAAQRVLANSKILRKLGYEVVLVGLSKELKRKEECFTFDGFQCINLPYPRNIIQWNRYLCSIKQYKKYINDKTNYIIAYNHPAIALRKMAEYCKKKNIKIISDCTEWYNPSGNPFFKAIKKWDVNKRMYKVHCQLDGIITISRFLNDFYQQQKVKTILLPPLVDLQEPKWNKVHRSDSQVIQLIYAGSLGKGNKDRVDMVIDALEKVAKNDTDNSFTLDVIGITKDNYLSIYPQKYHTPSFVTFHGRMPHEEVIQMLLNSDFQIFLREDHLANKAGFPTKFVESISSQTLVLTNPSSNLSDYMQEGENSFRLDISTQECLIESLKKPLSLSKQEIFEKRQKMDVAVFDYRHYVPAMKLFLSTI